MKLGPVLFFPALALTLPVVARAQASLGIGAGVVRYSGGSSFSALTASPAVQLLSSSFYLGAGGGVSLLAEGATAGQARTDVWAAIPLHPSSIRVAGSVALAFSTRSDGVAAGAGTALLETLWSRPRGGIAIGGGAVAGVIEGVPGVGALRLRARSWWQPAGAGGTSPSQLSLSVENTRLYGAWYTDLVGGATLEQPRLVGSLWLSARLSSVYISTAAASASLLYFIRPRIALELSGGNYLRDPFQGLPRAGFIGGAVRLFATSRALSPVPKPPNPNPLLAERRGDSVFVRFHMPHARSVAIAGNWNAWTPLNIRAVGADIWEAALALAPGTYYFNLVVDGTDWVVPGGVAIVSDGMGGMVAVLMAP
jgi:hypothetical protein